MDRIIMRITVTCNRVTFWYDPIRMVFSPATGADIQRGHCAVYTLIFKIKDFCIDRDISISTFERICGFSNGYISKIREKENPGVKAAQRRAQVMGITVEELMG